jgi:nuclear pore complex protein Nup98-Nup96
MSFGSFGSGGSSFNTSTSLFGSSSTPSTNLFGQPSNPSPLASTTTQQPTGSLFSNTFGGFGSTNQPQQQQQIASTGTQIKFNPPQGQDSVNKNGSSTTINTMHQCITAMKEYEGKSLEELRCEDYQANRRFPTSTSQFGSGGASSIFSTGGTTSGFGGSSTTSTSSSLFGSSTTPKPSLFGGSSTTTTQPQTSLFGQSTANQSNRSFFGSSTTTTPTASPFGGFGSQTQQPATTGFGSTQGQTSSLFGGLGGQQQQQTSGGLFGSSATTTPSSGGIFGAQQSKPLFSGFGQTAAPSTTTAAQPFSFQSQQTTTTTTPTGSIFGQASTQSPLSAAKPFGSTSFGGFGSGSATTTPAATGGFGATTTTSSGGVGLFGSPAASTQPKPFGSLGGATTTSTGFGGFGSPSTTSTTTAGGGIFGGFGSTSQQQTATTASPFGSTLGGGTTTTQSPFGQTSTTTGGGLFGSTQPSTGSTLTGSTSGFGFGQQTSSTTGGFGSTSTSGFGSTTSAQPLGLGLGATSTGTSTLGGTTGLFGSTPASTQQNQFTLGGGGLGGSTTSALGGGLGSTTGSTGGFGSFGLPSSTSVSSGLGGLGSAGSVGLNLQQQQQQQQFQLQQQQQQLQQQQLTPLLQQQLSNSPYGTGSLLKSTIQDLNKKEDIFKPVSPIAQRPYITEATSPAKVTSSLTSSVQGAELKAVGGLSQTIRITPKALTTISLNKPKNDLFEGLEDEEVPCFYPRKNIKKLLFKPQQHAQNESRRSSTTSSINGENINLGGRKSTVFPDDSYKYNITAGQLTTDSTNVSDDGAGGGADNQSEISNHNQHPANITLERPGYFTIPSMQELGGMINEKGDCLVENFAIGRVDYGCITFPGITNLTNLNLDEIVHIRRKEVHVYPDDTKKPQVGQGLNKPAEITLHRIWPTDKQTKTPITDPNRIIMMGYNKKIEKATIEMDAQFVDYDPATGSWTFKVKHFSKYGLNDSDDEEEDDKFINNKNNLNKLANLQQTTAKLTADNLCSKESINQEKEMINKQLKLIEERRKELMQQKNINKPITNLNSITNQQWDVINEYLPQVQTVSQKVIDHSNIHLELSSSESHDEDIDHNLDNKKPLRKQLELDNDVETDDNEFVDENKENQNGTIVDLYPSLKGFQSKSSGAKNLNIKKSGTTDKLYPSLNNLNINETYNVKFMDDGKNQQFSIEIDTKENIRLMGDYNNMEDNQQQQKIDELPFVTSMAAGSYLKNGNRRLLDTFFGSNDDRDTDDFGMADDDVVRKYKIT